jgi:hypothetical protein
MMPDDALEPLRPFNDKYYAIEEARDYEGYWEQGRANPAGDGSGKLHAETIALAAE